MKHTGDPSDNSILSAVVTLESSFASSNAPKSSSLGIVWPRMGATLVLEATNRKLHPIGVTIFRYTNAAYAPKDASEKP